MNVGLHWELNADPQFEQTSRNPTYHFYIFRVNSLALCSLLSGKTIVNPDLFRALFVFSPRIF